LRASFQAGQCTTTISTPLGQGKQGVVYEAAVFKDFTQQIPCAAKSLGKNQAEFRVLDRITRETRSSKEAGILSAIGMYKNDCGAQYFLMPKGDATLKNCMPAIIALQTQDPLLFSHVIITVMESMGRALHTHARLKIVHGDIKPENIVVRNGYCCLIDYGVAKKYAEFARSSGTLNGSPFYAAPEVIARDTGHPAKADIYAVGVILRQLLALPNLFLDCETVAALIFAKGKTYTDALKSSNNPTDLNPLNVDDTIIDCFKKIAAAMCHPLPTHRPDLTDLAIAFFTLKKRLATQPVPLSDATTFYRHMLFPAQTAGNNAAKQANQTGESMPPFSPRP
jgi:serine/threonine protein kinase